MAVIYQIQSTICPERIYIGSALNFKRRKQRHTTELNCNRHSNQKLQRHANKYGTSDLIFSVIEEFESGDREYVLAREQHYLDTLNPFFNILKVAGSAIGRTYTPEIRQKFSDSRKGMKFSELHSQHISESKTGENHPFFGKNFSDEHCSNISKALTGHVYKKGHKQTKEHKYNAAMARRFNMLGNGVIDLLIADLEERRRLI